MRHKEIKSSILLLLFSSFDMIASVDVTEHQNDLTKIKVIQSKNFPKLYEDNTYDTWIIKAPPSGHQTVLRLDSIFDIEPQRVCKYDYLSINGVRYCNSKKLKQFVYDKKLTIVFRSDESVRKRGFKIRWSYQPKNEFKCTCKNGIPKYGEGKCIKNWEDCLVCHKGYELNPWWQSSRIKYYFEDNRITSYKKMVNYEKRAYCMKKETANNVIRSGMTIALESVCNSQNQYNNWVSHHWKQHGKQSTLETCNPESDRRGCGGEQVVIYAEGKAYGEPIENTDEIMMYYGNNGWVSSEGKEFSKVAKQNCPSNRNGMRLAGKNYYYTTKNWKMPSGCGWEKWRIYEKNSGEQKNVIRHNDKVYLRRYGTKQSWMSADHNNVNTRSCPGARVPVNHDCDCEQFRIKTLDYNRQGF